MDWYPLRLTTPTRPYVFGGTLIADWLGRRDLPARRLAETWEVSDVEEDIAQVADGPLAGRSLRELTLAHPDDLVGPGWRGPYFPLLTKFIDATDMLPVHLHADDATAQRLDGQQNGSKANRARSRVRSAIETVFASQKHRFGLFVRTIGLARARTKIGLANLAYNLKRFLWIETRSVAA